jgi:hypothetical protein
MMIKIYGHNDDCFEIDGTFRGENEISCFEKQAIIQVYDFTFAKGVIVIGEYDKNNRAGVWSISVEPVDEDNPMPEMWLEMAPNGYSPMLIIECSENTAVSSVEQSR